MAERILMAEFSGKTVLVTGAAGDIGRAVCHAFVDAGATVVAVGRSAPERAAALLDGQPPERLIYVTADVTDRAAVDAFVDGPEGLDIVIGNAGIVEPTPYIDVSVESWQRQLNINLTGNFHVTQAAIRRFVRDGTAGSIVLTGSWVGERPWPEVAAYSASKAGLQMLARSIALEHAKDGIRCNVVAPGIVNAGLARAEVERNPEYAARAAKVVPLGALQEPEDVAAVTFFLCTPAAASVTGSTYLVDGGSSLGSL
jgi:NAD(P)-dependent dehydrogenase (short-subunit alcohol dehydrogenase family)